MNTVPDPVKPRPVEHLYRLFDDEGTLLYVGVSNNWTQRFTQHMATKSWWSEVARVDLVAVASSRQKIEAIERAVIKAERPLYNVAHSATTAVAERSAPSARFVVGERVNHCHLGDGEVIRSQGRGHRCNLTIRFVTVGVRYVSAVDPALAVAK